MKSAWQYQDATNVIGYYSNPVDVPTNKLPIELNDFDKSYFIGDRVVVDAAMARNLVKSKVTSRRQNLQTAANR